MTIRRRRGSRTPGGRAGRRRKTLARHEAPPPDDGVDVALDDFIARKGEDDVDRKALLVALKDFLQANNLKADWEGIEKAPNEALVNALAMMSPYGPAEKQALLEAPDLKTRAEILIAVTEIELAKGRTEDEPPLQ